MDKAFFWCVVGMISFWIGGALRMYMVVRVKGWAGYLTKQKGVVASYHDLAKQHKAPFWPLPMSYMCIVLGVVFAFGSILIFNISNKR